MERRGNGTGESVEFIVGRDEAVRVWLPQDADGEQQT